MFRDPTRTASVSLSRRSATAGVEVRRTGERGERGQHRWIAAELEPLLGRVAVRVGVEVADRLDLRVALHDRGGVGEPGGAGGGTPRGRDAELADHDGFRVG